MEAQHADEELQRWLTDYKKKQAQSMRTHTFRTTQRIPASPYNYTDSAALVGGEVAIRASIESACHAWYEHLKCLSVQSLRHLTALPQREGRRQVVDVVSSGCLDSAERDSRAANEVAEEQWRGHLQTLFKSRYPPPNVHPSADRFGEAAAQCICEESFMRKAMCDGEEKWRDAFQCAFRARLADVIVKMQQWAGGSDFCREDEQPQFALQMGRAEAAMRNAVERLEIQCRRILDIQCSSILPPVPSNAADNQQSQEQHVDCRMLVEKLECDERWMVVGAEHQWWKDTQAHFRQEHFAHTNTTGPIPLDPSPLVSSEKMSRERIEVAEEQWRLCLLAQHSTEQRESEVKEAAIREWRENVYSAAQQELQGSESEERNVIDMREAQWMAHLVGMEAAEAPTAHLRYAKPPATLPPSPQLLCTVAEEEIERGRIAVGETNWRQLNENLFKQQVLSRCCACQELVRIELPEEEQFRTCILAAEAKWRDFFVSQSKVVASRARKCGTSTSDP